MTLTECHSLGCKTMSSTSPAFCTDWDGQPVQQDHPAWVWGADLGAAGQHKLKESGPWHPRVNHLKGDEDHRPSSSRSFLPSPLTVQFQQCFMKKETSTGVQATYAYVSMAQPDEWLSESENQNEMKLPENV